MGGSSWTNDARTQKVRQATQLQGWWRILKVEKCKIWEDLFVGYLRNMVKDLRRARIKLAIFKSVNFGERICPDGKTGSYCETVLSKNQWNMGNKFIKISQLMVLSHTESKATLFRWLLVVRKRTVGCWWRKYSYCWGWMVKRWKMPEIYISAVQGDNIAGSYGSFEAFLCLTKVTYYCANEAKN